MVAHAFHRIAAFGKAAGLHGEVLKVGRINLARIILAELLLQPVRHGILAVIEALRHDMEAVGDAPGDFACEVLHPGVAEQVEDRCQYHLDRRLSRFGVGHFSCAWLMLDRELGQFGLLHERPGIIGRGDFARVVFGKVGEVREAVRHDNLQMEFSLITLMKDVP